MFAYNTLLLDPTAGLRAVEEISARSGTRGRPRRTIDDILDTLARRYDMDDTVGILRDAATASS